MFEGHLFGRAHTAACDGGGVAEADRRRLHRDALEKLRSTDFRGKVHEHRLVDMPASETITLNPKP